MTVPSALSPDGDRAFFMNPPNFASERFILDPGIVLNSSFISVGSIDGIRHDEDLTFSGKKEYSTCEMTYVPNPREPSGGELITLIKSGTNARRDVVAINLRTKRYQSLLPPDWPRWELDYTFSVSPDGKLVVVSCRLGIVVWALHEYPSTGPA